MVTPISESASAAPSALIELEIPGRTGPLPEPPAAPGEVLWGINHGAALDNFPLHGLQVYISPWSSMGVGDSVRVMLNGTTVVATETIESGEQNQRVTTFVPAARITSGQYTLHYIVKRFGQTDDPSAETKILVKLDRPGGQDQDGDTPGHSELKFDLPQDIIDDGVDADAARAGVLVTIKAYPNMAAGDNIKLSWGGQFVSYTVQESDLNQDVEICVDEATILDAGDSGINGLAVTYEVYDVVQNRSEDWAAETRITVDTGNSRLPSPFVEEAVNNTLDLDVLGEAPATVQIIAASLNATAQNLSTEIASISKGARGRETPESIRAALKADFTRGDKILVTVTGTTLDGEAVSYDAPAVTIDNLPHVYPIPVPNLFVRQLAKTQARFSYRLVHVDATETVSKSAFINIIGEPTRMAAPVALDSAQGAIDPDLSSTRIEIPWDDSMARGDQIVLKWIGTRPDFTIYDPQLPPHPISNGEANDKLPIMMTVSGNHLKAIEGGMLELYYILEKDMGGTIGKRESARAAKLNVGEPKAELPAPTVSGIVDGVMDPGLTSADLTVPNYTGKALGDEVHYLWKGSESGDRTDSVTVNSFTLPTPITFTIPSSAIAPNEDGTVAASYWVIRKSDNRRSDSEILTFNVGEPVVLDPPTLSTIKGSNGVDIPEGASTSDTTVTVTGTAPAGEKVDIFDGSVSQGEVTAGADGLWTKTLTGLALTTHAIKAVARYGDGAESAVRRFTVVAMVVPTLTSIKDSKSVEIPEGASTFDTSVTVTGSAQANQQVEVFDGGTSKGTALANAAGVWTLPLTGLTAAAYAIKAVALYGDGAESAVRRFTVVVVTAVAITEVEDSQGNPIANGGTTTDTSITLSGTVTYSA